MISLLHLSRLTVVMLLLGLIGMSGCNIAGPVAWAVSPVPTRPAVFELADRPTVIFVDDPRGVLGYRQLRRVIADRASQELLSKGAMTTIISSRDAMAIVDQNDRHSEKLSVAAIGQSVGAEQIVYVQILQAMPSLDGQTAQPAGVCTVKVIDVTRGERLFPIVEDDQEDAGRAGHMLQVITPQQASEMPSLLQSFQVLADRMGSDIAKLFYEHEAEKLGTNLSGPR